MNEEKKWLKRLKDKDYAFNYSFSRHLLAEFYETKMVKLHFVLGGWSTLPFFLVANVEIARFNFTILPWLDSTSVSY